MIKKNFETDYLTQTLGLPWNDEYVVEDEIIDTGRWDIYHRLVFQDLDGTYWETKYWHGATELQPERPWEYDTEVECIQVEKRVVPITKFLPVCEETANYFREPTAEEREMVDEYLRSVSYETGIHFSDVLELKFGDDWR